MWPSHKVLFRRTCGALYRPIAVIIALVVLFAGPSVFAQNEDIQELKATMEAMQKTIAAQNARIATLEKQQTQLQQQLKATPTGGHGQDLNVPVARLPAATSPGVASHGAHDKDSIIAPAKDAAASSVPPGFFAIPSTDTLLKIGGSARLDAISDQRNNGNPNEFVTSTIPVPGQPGANSGTQSTVETKGSRLSLELLRPSPPDNTFRIYSEVDFFNDSESSSMSLRVRHFYVEGWHFLVGQSFSAFMDIGVYPDVIDYEGPNGIIYKRQPQIRYTLPVYEGQGKEKVKLFASIEQPDSEIDQSDSPPGTAGSPISHVPDGVIGSRWEGEFGHLQGAAVFRDLSYETAGGHGVGTLGWGGSLSGAFNVFGKDSLLTQVSYGKGMSHYVNDLGGESLDAALIGGQLQALPVFATTAAYTHQWSDHWRSTVSGGYVHLDAPGSLDPFTLDSTVYASANLVWQASPSLSVGLEYLYGYKETLNGAARDAQRLDFMIRYDFTK